MYISGIKNSDRIARELVGLHNDPDRQVKIRVVKVRKSTEHTETIIC